MGNSPSRRKISAQDKAILDMKNQRDKLHQYQRRITILTDKEREIAKEMLAQGNRSKAQLALRRKKYQESLLAKTDAQLEQLEKLTNSVEFALIQKDIIYGLEQGTNVLKSIHREIGGIDHVEKLMGDTAEAIAYQEQEISDMLGGQMTNQDEDEVEDELSALEVELNPNIAMPSVPGTSLPVKYDKKRQQEPAEPIAMLT
ncbi:Bgt-165 [Blumeria graminis f. sp. tritici]|uniref:Bgt-165 n=2 Tax=Blumeria graminis f. sp. tritici TaxID=62690 RepID=A0A061HMT7_BLUGR|nr:Myristoylated subunit of ESCRTIII the endosomal sorting complex [Blumeria graminis f. sp. tritici 96224]VCU39658.1 Bgt-165 [Blumeria graminis f. sp. tritici]